MHYSFSSTIAGREIVLDDFESHHLVSVRRGREGEKVRVLDGRGTVAECRIAKPDQRRCLLAVESLRVIQRDQPPLWLIQAVPLGKAMETIVQKAAELGAARVTPLLSERSEMRLDSERASKKCAKWLQEAVEAVKQCGTPFIPAIDEPMSLAALLSQPLPRARLCCSLEPDARSFSQVIAEVDCSEGLAIAIGPEGDFSASEYGLLRANAFQPASLRPLVLRSDTAAIASLAVASELLRA